MVPAENITVLNFGLDLLSHTPTPTAPAKLVNSYSGTTPRYFSSLANLYASIYRIALRNSVDVDTRYCTRLCAAYRAWCAV